MSASAQKDSFLQAVSFGYFWYVGPAFFLWSVTHLPDAPRFLTDIRPVCWIPLANWLAAILSPLFSLGLPFSNGFAMFAAFWALFGLWIAVAPAIGYFAIGLLFAPSIEAEARAASEALAKEERARAAAERTKALAVLAELVDAARASAQFLAISLAEAHLALDKAEAELSARLFSPFWEAMEAATSHLADFDETLSRLNAARDQYRALAADLGGEIPSFSLGPLVLPDPSETSARLLDLYRRAQKDPNYATVYEQRRTSAILIAGFRSLGQAIEQLGDRVVYSINSLATLLEARLAGLEDSLQSSASAAAAQLSAARLELQAARDTNQATMASLARNMDARADSERLALRMLDNIQRRRHPTIFERP